MSEEVKSAIRAVHEMAMDLADNADHMRKRGKASENEIYYAKRTFEVAYVLELWVADRMTREPSRSVTYRSAASLALMADMVDEAEQAAEEGLKGEPPSDIFDELMDVLSEVQRIKERT